MTKCKFIVKNCSLKYWLRFLHIFVPDTKITFVYNFVAPLTNKVINNFTGALVTISIGRTVIVISNHLSKIQHRGLLPPYTAEHHHAQVLGRMIISSGLYWIGQLEATLLNVSTLFISLYQW